MDGRAPGSGADLASWLAWAGRVNPRPMELGLERVRTMIGRLGIGFRCPVLTVAGTNGKGSTCALLDSMLRAGGYRVCLHTSPHLLAFNERAVVSGRALGDAALCRGMARVEEVRGDLPLTYFEFTILAILTRFMAADPDAVILEIGLGGRLDAVNAVEPDCSVIASVGLDHTRWLGPTRDSVGLEKAHIYRPGRPAIFSGDDPPASVLAHAARVGADLLLAERDFWLRASGAGSWDFSCPRLGVSWSDLPPPALAGAHQLANAAGALAALAALSDRLPLCREDLARGLSGVSLAGRCQRLRPAGDGAPEIIIDVAHNPQAAARLADFLRAGRRPGEAVHAVFGMLADKDISAVIRALEGVIGRWFIAPLPPPRGADLAALRERFAAAGVDPGRIRASDSIAAALGAALEDARGGSGGAVKIVVFGSFLTVAAVLARPDLTGVAPSVPSAS